MLTTSPKLPMLRALPLLLITGLLISACATSTPSATENTICRELRGDLPSYSRKDTEQSKQEGVKFLTTFHAVCPG